MTMWWDLLKEDTEQVILREIEKEGGALGMKNLREVVPDEDKLKSTLDDMINQGKIFVHEDGIYYHNINPKTKWKKVVPVVIVWAAWLLWTS